jgi:hypothetical protein
MFCKSRKIGVFHASGSVVMKNAAAGRRGNATGVSVPQQDMAGHRAGCTTVLLDPAAGARYIRGHGEAAPGQTMFVPPGQGWKMGWGQR